MSTGYEWKCRDEIIEVVVKRPCVNDDGPGDPGFEVTHEAKMLQALTPHVLVPQLIAVDPTGQYAGSPAIVQTLLPGRSLLTVKALSLDDWIHGLALATQTVSLMKPLSDSAKLPRFQPWFSFDKLPPSWSTATPDEWFDMQASLFKSLPAAAASDRFIHRDLHPGNVLFSNANVTGLVDWTNSAWGPFEADVSRCRVEIALLAGFKAADTYLQDCKNLCADILPTYDYRWDKLVALELAPWVSDLVECANETGARITEDSVAATLNHYIDNDYDADKWE